jgi:isocitrate dehydrogenase kinase/phosphatase
MKVFQMVLPLAMLAVESGGVVALRMMKLMLGGSDALYEAELMVSEKVHAAFEATASLIAGASGDDVIHRYRQHVAANAARLANRR